MLANLISCKTYFNTRYDVKGEHDVEKRPEMWRACSLGRAVLAFVCGGEGARQQGSKAVRQQSRKAGRQKAERKLELIVCSLLLRTYTVCIRKYIGVKIAEKSSILPTARLQHRR
jgi:hypothetical protein